MSKKLLCALTMLLMSTQCYATQISVFKTYATNDQVTAANLNGNISNIVTVVNGNLDNTNANTTSGYRFFEVLGALPAAGTQGRCVFLTTANTLNFDSGTAWNSVVSAASPAQGDILYYNGTAWTKLTAGTSGQYLKTQGAGANPTWDTVLPWTKIIWVNTDGAGNINDSYGVSSITNGDGDDTINFDGNFASANYCGIAGSNGNNATFCSLGTLAVGSVHVLTRTDGGAATNVAYSLTCFGD